MMIERKAGRKKKRAMEQENMNREYNLKFKAPSEGQIIGEIRSNIQSSVSNR